MGTRTEEAIEAAASQLSKAVNSDSLAKGNVQGAAAIVTLLTALLREVADLRVELQASRKTEG